MKRIEKYDTLFVGALSGFTVPLIVAFFVFLFSSGHSNLMEYFQRIREANIITHIISLCVFPNIFLFLIFNRLDMLRAARGVLGITIFWAVLVFAVKFIA
jgi:hypothetical protein